MEIRSIEKRILSATAVQSKTGEAKPGCKGELNTTKPISFIPHASEKLLLKMKAEYDC